MIVCVICNKMETWSFINSKIKNYFKWKDYKISLLKGILSCILATIINILLLNLKFKTIYGYGLVLEIIYINTHNNNPSLLKLILKINYSGQVHMIKEMIRETPKIQN